MATTLASPLVVDAPGADRRGLAFFATRPQVRAEVGHVSDYRLRSPQIKRGGRGLRCSADNLRNAPAHLCHSSGVPSALLHVAHLMIAPEPRPQEDEMYRHSSDFLHLDRVRILR